MGRARGCAGAHFRQGGGTLRESLELSPMIAVRCATAPASLTAYGLSISRPKRGKSSSPKSAAFKPPSLGEPTNSGGGGFSKYGRQANPGCAVLKRPAIRATMGGRMRRWRVGRKHTRRSSGTKSPGLQNSVLVQVCGLSSSKRSPVH